MFHINTKTGEVGKCSAKKGNCPFGSVELHFTTAEDARDNFENSQEGSFTANLEMRRRWSQSSDKGNKRGELPTEQLNFPVRARTYEDRHLAAIKDSTKPINWDEMSSSSKDLWEEKGALNLAQEEVREAWHQELRDKIKSEPEWVKTLGNKSLDTLAHILAGGGTVNRRAFDNGKLNSEEDVVVYKEIGVRASK